MSVDWSQFHPVAAMSLNEDGTGITVRITDAALGSECEVVYVWVDATGSPLRVGTTRHRVAARLRQYTTHINKASGGLRSPTPEWEAQRWLELVRGQELTALVHKPPTLMTAVGSICPYLDIERHMIATLKPPLNRSHR